METSGGPSTPPEGAVDRWAEVGERAEGGYLEYFLSHIPGSEVRQAPEGTYFRSGFPHPMFNGVTLVGLPPDPAPVLRSAREVCQGKAGWGVQASDRLLRAWGERFPAAQFREFDSLPGMVLEDLHRPEPALPSGLTIAKVAHWREMGTFLATAAVGFGFPVGAFSQLLHRKPLEGFLQDRRASWLVGLVGGQPVATAMSILLGEVSYVSFVSTVREHRKRGYGEALTWRASLAGREAGARAAFLRATKMGAPVYRKMGYREVGTYHYLQAVGPGDRPRLRSAASILRILGASLGYRLTGGGYRRWPVSERAAA